MILGSSETLGTRGNNLFSTLDLKWKIFKRSATIMTPDLYDFPTFSKTKNITTGLDNPSGIYPEYSIFGGSAIIEQLCSGRCSGK